MLWLSWGFDNSSASVDCLAVLFLMENRAKEYTKAKTLGQVWWATAETAYVIALSKTVTGLHSAAMYYVQPTKSSKSLEFMI